MTSRHAATLWAFLIGVTVYGQTLAPCRSIDPQVDPLSDPALQPLQPRGSGPYTIRLYLHVLRMANGTLGQSQDAVNTALCYLRTDYEPHGIRFHVAAQSFIDDDGLYVHEPADYGVLMTDYSQPDGINVFFYGPDQMNAGFAPIGGNLVYLGGALLGVDLVTNHVISHEVGHCFGLVHTHRATGGGPGCAELVNGTNCTTCGDFICDTPADPGLNFFDGDVDGGTCTWLGAGSDANGDPYAPEMHNIMSYTHPDCQTDFTPDQVGRLFDLIANSTIIQGWMTTEDQEWGTIDLYMRDVEFDTGYNPGYPWGWYFDHSPDIWVRNEPDGQTVQEHQNPEYQASDPDFVYVRVRNRACVPSLGSETLRLYWTKESTSTSWPQNWDGSNPNIGDVIGTLTIPELGPGESIILEFEWQIANPYIFNNWSTCLLARIEGSTEDPITVYPGQAELDVYHNNNIALRNTTVVDIVPGMQPTVIDGVKYPPGVFTFVGNAEPTASTSDLRFDAPASEGRTVVDEAEVHVIFDAPGWAKVAPRLSQATGLKQFLEGDLVLTDAQAMIPGVEWPARTVFPLYVGYNFLCAAVTGPRSFVLHMSQNVSGDQTHLLGAEHFTVRWSPRPLFVADGGVDKQVPKEQSTTLMASSIAENAVYKWYDEGGALIATGASVSVTPMISAKYKLEIISDLDGFKDYDEVAVQVKDAWISSVHPNPAQSNVVVEYHLESGSSGYVTLNKVGESVFHNFILSSTSEVTTLDLQQLMPGQYQGLLIREGTAVDAFQLMIVP